jgi:hypothetical protein
VKGLAEPALSDIDLNDLVERDLVLAPVVELGNAVDACAAIWRTLSLLYGVIGGRLRASSGGTYEL